MKILAFDTSTKFLSIALLNDEKVVSEYHKEEGIRHSEVLIPQAKEMLAKAGWKVSDIGLIAVGIGPGSFTGLRIAVSTAKGIAASLGTKVVGVPSMDAMVMNFSKKARVMPLLDAHKGKVYACLYEAGRVGHEKRTEYLLMPVQELLDLVKEEVLIFGSAVVKYKDILDKHPFVRYISDADWYPRAVSIGRLGLARYLLRGDDDPETLDPLYLHPKECNVTKKSR